MDRDIDGGDQRVPKGSRTSEERIRPRDGKPSTESKRKKEAMDVRKEKREQVIFFGKVCSKKAVFATVPARRAHGWVSMNDRFVTEHNHSLLWHTAHLPNLNFGITHRTTTNGYR